MRAPSLLFIAFLSLSACCAPTPLSTTDPNWRELTDGSHLEGWQMAGPGNFVIEDNSLMATGGMGLLWYSNESFEDFELSLEWKVASAANNSGVFVRFPNPGNDPWVAVNKGYEIQICDTAAEKHNTGSVYSFKAPSAIPTKPVGEWNIMIIQVVGQEYVVKVNGTEVCRYTGDRSTEGFVGLQNHDDESPVRYRNIRARAIN